MQSLFPGLPTLDEATSRFIGTYEIPVVGERGPDPTAVGGPSGRSTLAVENITLTHDYGVIAIYDYDDAGHAPDPFYFWTALDGLPHPTCRTDIGASYRLQPLYDSDHDNPAIQEGHTYFQNHVLIGDPPGAFDVTLILGTGWLSWMTVDGAAVVHEAPPPPGRITLYEWWQLPGVNVPPQPPCPPLTRPPWPYKVAPPQRFTGPSGSVRLHGRWAAQQGSKPPGGQAYTGARVIGTPTPPVEMRQPRQQPALPKPAPARKVPDGSGVRRTS